MRIKSKASQWNSMARKIARFTYNQVSFSDGFDASLQGKSSMSAEAALPALRSCPVHRAAVDARASSLDRHCRNVRNAPL
jgi:hypothetical protein